MGLGDGQGAGRQGVSGSEAEGRRGGQQRHPSNTTLMSMHPHGLLAPSPAPSSPSPVPLPLTPSLSPLHRWLKDASTDKDFFIDLPSLPSV